MTDISEYPDIPAELRQRMLDFYRHLHANPELSMQEHATAAFIEAHLDTLGIEHFRCGGTGVVGVLRNGEGPVVGFRADTDGLPIQEDSTVDYRSTARGTLADGTEVPVMHGCGHDTHVAALMTAAEVLAADRDSWSGTLVLLFQPGEETAAGAQAMVEDGLWEKAPQPEIIYGQHVMPGLAGTVEVVSGPAMAYADSWKVTLYGEQSHGSQPQDSIDPIVLGAHIVTRLQGIVSREIGPRRAAVVTVGTFHAGLKENIIPATAEFTLNVRTMEDDVRESVLAAIRRIISAEAAASGAPEPRIEELYRFPRNLNDPDATAALAEVLRGALGAENVLDGEPRMGSEDFGTLPGALGVPSVFWFFGGFDAATVESGTMPVNHSPRFVPVPEPTLWTAATAALAALRSRLGS
ncbi:putative amidohydrolase [Citricoccus zhacaiensis]|uniref:Amidohydrolase n=1 Tax=Citricoccus zhacaiensis TaxID=489142 RepID=A0ABQ2M5Q3_9MICC|nr:amidohydrolase [Citricoccus zhacaiensis]GGO47519.1 putative amidohydrolase [Citricoccus zhacaiensis]